MSIAHQTPKPESSQPTRLRASVRSTVDPAHARASAGIAEAHAGESVAYTEPVPGYLFDAMGLENVTPEAFSEAIEEGTDVSPAVLSETLQLFSAGSVDLLAYNEQTTGSTTEQVLAAAKRAGVPIVGVRETLPDGQDYLQWMQQDLADLRAAVTR